MLQSKLQFKLQSLLSKVVILADTLIKAAYRVSSQFDLER